MNFPTNRAMLRGALRPAVCVAALFSGTAVLADVTAQQVWDNWKDSFGIYGTEGMTIGSEVLDGGTLTVTDLNITMTEGADVVEGSLASLVFTENGDGTVSVTMSDEYPITITSAGYDGEEVINLILRQTGGTMTVSGTPEAMAYDYSAERYAIVLDSVQTADDVVVNDVQFGLNNVTGSYSFGTDDVTGNLVFAIEAASVDIVADVEQPSSMMTFDLFGTVADFAAYGDISAPMEPQPGAELEGFLFDAGYSFGEASYEFTAVQANLETAGTAGAAAGGVALFIDETMVSIEAGTQGIHLDLGSDELPFPVSIRLEEYGLGFAMPLQANDAPADFSASANVTGLAVNEELWGMLDPGAVLPRDPLTAIVALSGSITLLVDAPMIAMAQAMGEEPVQINALSLDALQLSFAGAEVTGQGAFTFDNSDLTTFPGVPRPEGEANFAINGINGLLDKLVQLGVVPADQAMMPRMFIGMFGVPVGDDQLTTSVSIGAAGEIQVNGAPLPF